MITVPIHEGEALPGGQLSFDNPDVAMAELIYTVVTIVMGRELVSRKYSKNYRRDDILSRGNLAGKLSL